MSDVFSQFHFLRPWWLLALLPAALVLWRLARRQADARAWARVIDAHLLRHLLGGDRASQGASALSVLGAAWTITVIALAGPTWSKAPQATYRAQHALVVVLSLAPTMDAGDTAPSRLVRARLKVLDILARRHDGQTALIAYSDAPYVVAPLTEDAGTIAALVPVLATDVMPAPGDRLSAALERAGELFAHAGVARGDVLVVTDSPGDARAGQAAGALGAAGHRVSVLAVGGAEGAPIPRRGGGFLTDATGAIVVHRVDAVRLQQLAATGGGGFATLTIDDGDLAAVLEKPDEDAAAKRADSNSAVTRWRDEGPWLVVMLLPLAALLFRRGWMFGLGAIACLHLPSPAQAFEFEDLWLRKEQRAEHALKMQDYERAAELSADPLRRGEALFRARKYAEAAEAFARVDSAEGHYNRGNALAKAGKYAEARAAYQAALGKIPTHADAKYNKMLIDQILERTPPPPAPQQPRDTNDASGGGGQGRPQNGTSDTAERNRDAPAPRASTGGTDAMSRSPSRDAGAAGNGGDTALAAQPVGATSPGSEGQSASAQSLEQWLGKVPDDPGGLLREKFRREYLRRMQQEEGKR